MKKLVILGAGESGVGTAILAKKKGYEVFVSDASAIKPKYKDILMQNNIVWEENGHTESLILDASEVVKSPGIPDKAPLIQKIKQKNIPIISEIEFAGRYTSAKMICITGSNGKTTTTMLTYHILKSAGLNVGLAGNVGHSFARQVAEANFDYFVLELSSFQLDNMYDFKADIAILLNITPDHLDRYGYEFQNYIDSKFRITQNQTEKDAFIYWNDDPVIQAELAKRNIKVVKYPFALDKKKGVRAFIENLELVIHSLKDEFRVPVEELALEGVHNTYNSMAAGLSANIMEIKKDKIRQALSDFQGVEHRLEYVATVRGVRFINDSKATNVNSCWYALQSMRTPTVLILGGIDKGNDYTEIEKLVKEKVHALVFLGVDNSKLKAFFGDKIKTIVEVQSMKDAVAESFRLAKKDDTVLLSPCCASFDLFENYEDRGNQFKDYVKNL
ncbi:MAG: UDP-N-acetylmuramoyl-L-alanine--D-glutamate ligase [Prevotellaceae bacterium]|jgi:UDP-N-acetylmuramoylalanine--D-glutamate ligase|nr:UDP-N-acetylmuramoyl-L-alanine--D-glutamate ligase [Prevotellaceae bacterium]